MCVVFIKCIGKSRYLLCFQKLNGMIDLDFTNGGQVYFESQFIRKFTFRKLSIKLVLSEISQKRSAPHLNEINYDKVEFFGSIFDLILEEIILA